MRTHVVLSISVLIATSFSSPAMAAAKTDDAKKEIKERWAECTALQQKKGVKRAVLIDADDDPESVTQWVPAKSAREAQDSFDKVEMVFNESKNLIYSSVQMGSQSGDHSYKTEYCFRKNGSLAFLFRTFKTTQGLPYGVKEERRIWIDTQKKKIDDEIKVLNSQTGKEIKKADQNYFQPDNMGWNTIPKSPETFEAKTFLSDYPKPNL